MSAEQWLGAAIIAAVLVGMFIFTAQIDGWIAAALVWLGSIALTAGIVFALMLLAGEVTLGLGR